MSSRLVMVIVLSVKALMIVGWAGWLLRGALWP